MDGGPRAATSGRGRHVLAGVVGPQAAGKHRPPAYLYCRRSMFRTKSLRAPAGSQCGRAPLPGQHAGQLTAHCPRGARTPALQAQAAAGAHARPAGQFPVHAQCKRPETHAKMPLAPGLAAPPLPTCRLREVEHPQRGQQRAPRLHAGLGHRAQAVVGEQRAPLHLQLLKGATMGGGPLQGGCAARQAGATVQQYHQDLACVIRWGDLCTRSHGRAVRALQLGTPRAVQAGRGLCWSPGAGPV